MNSRLPALLLCALLVPGAACHDSTPPAAPVSDAPVRVSSVPTGLPFDVDAVVRQVHAAAPSPASLTASLSPESALDTPVSDPSAGTQSLPAIASNGTDYLVVWVSDEDGNRLSIRGTRVKKDGTILDPLGFVLGFEIFNAERSRPAVAFDGTNYLVVTAVADSLYGLQVSPSAGPMSAEARLIFRAGDSALLTRPAIVHAGTNYLVVWEQEAYSGSFTKNLLGLPVSREGRAMGPAPFVVCNALYEQRAVSLAFDGTNALAVWEDTRHSPHSAALQRDIYAARISPAGVVLDPSSLPVTTESHAQYLPAVAFNGSHYLVVWADERGSSMGGVGQLHGTRMARDGSLLEATPFPVPGATISDAPSSAPTLVGLRGEFLLSWTALQRLHAVRLEGSGQVIGGTELPLPPSAGEQMQAAVATQGEGFLIAWHEALTSNILGARLSAAGTLLDTRGRTLSFAINHQFAPVASYDGTNFLVVWEDNRDALNGIYGLRVRPDGTWVDASAFPIARPGDGPRASHRSPSVAFNGQNHLVVWTQGSQGTAFVRGARVSPEGTVLDPAGLRISEEGESGYKPKVASNGTDFLVVWEAPSPWYTAYRGKLHSRAVSATGALSGARLVHESKSFIESSVLSFNGTNYLVAWFIYDSDSDSDPNLARSLVYGARLSKEGGLTDSSPLSFGSGTRSVYSLALGSDRTNHLLVRTLRVDSRSTLVAQRVSPNGVILDPTPIVLETSPGAPPHPAATFDGKNFLVIWRGLALKGRRVSPTGALVNENPFTLSEQHYPEGVHTLVSAGAQVSLFVYQSLETFQGVGGVKRLKTRRLDLNASPPAVGDLSAQTPEDTALVLPFPETDAEGDPLRYLVMSGPAHGTITDGVPRKYQPAPDYFGPDTFTFVASDGPTRSAPATFSLTVTPVNDAPVATPQSLTTLEDTPLALVLSGSDVDGDALGFTLGRAPGHGTLTGTPPHLTYTPAPNHYGSDSFTFSVSDGKATSAPATVTLNITAVNDAPVAAPQSLATPEDTPLALTLTATDVEDLGLRFAVSSGPSHGTLTGTPPQLRYTPARDYSGADSFTFTASDGRATSAPATVSLSVTPVDDPPVADSQSLTLAEDTSSRFEYSASDVDVDGDPLSVTVTSGPRHGSVVNFPLTGVYFPHLNYHGTDSLTFSVSDGRSTRSGTITWTITPVNDPPLAASEAYTSPEDTLFSLALPAADPDGDKLTLTVTSGPSHGTLSASGLYVNYYPARDYHGPDSFTFTVSDGQYTSDPATISLTLTPVNDTPVAETQWLTTEEDTPVAVTLTGSDVEGDALSYRVVSPPYRGRLTGTPPNLVYTPSSDYHGGASFTFTVSDGQATSAPATVSLTITPVNDAPRAWNDSFTLAEDTSRGVVLNGYDAEGSALGFSVASAPSHGTLTGTPPQLTYTPAPDYHGPDQFTFTVSDGKLTSTPGTISLTVTPVNDAPVATPQSLSTLEDTPLALTLLGSDVDGDSLFSYSYRAPGHGTLTGTPPHLTYTPARDYSGPDSFTFTVNDGRVESAPATVSLTVAAVNDAPVARSQSLSSHEDIAVSVTLTGSDVEGGPLTFQVAEGPGHGVLTGAPPHLTYTPARDYHGQDRFTFTVSDGEATSETATVLVVLSAVNDDPLAVSQSFTFEEDTLFDFTLQGSDVDGDALTFTLLEAPLHGGLIGTPPNLTYLPMPDFHGSDRIVFTVHDGRETAAPATVSLRVSPVNDVPVALSQTHALAEDSTLALTLRGMDADADALSFRVESGPSHGTLTGTPPRLTYTPAPDYSGPDAFSFVASDGRATSSPGRVDLLVLAVNDAPGASAQVLTLEEDTSLPVTLAGVDGDGDPLRFTVATRPRHGTLTGAPPRLTYTPAPDFHGTDDFTFRVSDGQVDSGPATVSLTVSPVQDAPVATALVLQTNEDRALEVVLSGSDADGDALGFTVTSAPGHGTLTGTPPRLTYTPAPDFHGPEGFAFTVSDGHRVSAPATVTVTVLSVNDVPVALAQELTVAMGHPAPVFLSARDVDGQPLTFSLLSPPEVGTLSGKPPEVVYLPPAGFQGTTHFTFAVTDGQASSRAQVQLTVVKRSLTVSAVADSRHPVRGRPVRFHANAVDEAGAPLSLTWDFGDGHTSGEEHPEHVFTTPGPHEVRLLATTATEQATASLFVHVGEAGGYALSERAPATAVVVGEEGAPLSFHIDEADPALTYSWDFGTGGAPERGAEVSHVWAEDGRFMLTVTALDTSGARRWVASRAVTIHNAAPVPRPQPRVSAVVGRAVTVQLEATDAGGAGDPLHWSLAGGGGTLSAGGLFQWTPTASGLTTVVTRVLDDDGGETRLAFQVAVTEAAGDDAPRGCACGASGGGAGDFVAWVGLVALLLVSARRAPLRGPRG